MDSSDEDFLPDPNRPRKRKRPPDQGEASGSKKRKEPDEPDNKLKHQSLSIRVVWSITGNIMIFSINL